MPAPEQSMLRTANAAPLDCRPEGGMKPNGFAIGFFAAIPYLERNIP